MRRRGAAAWLVFLPALFLNGCMSSHQSALDAAGPHSQSILNLWWFFLILLGAIFVLVMSLAIAALFRRKPAADRNLLEQTHTAPASTEKRLFRIVGTATVITTLILFVLIIVSVLTGKSISAPGSASKPLVVTVVGNQWWWYFRYESEDPNQIVVTANELHVPVGRPVLINGTSYDVIHSFWAPNLQGKRDLIPSRTTTEFFVADRPGRFRGQCAEFCGLEHAKMALWVVAETPERFAAWMKDQLQPSVAPSNPDTQRGLQVFLNHACVYCHTIAGTAAHGEVGPDLTHLASRGTIAAGTLPNDKGDLAGWISDPQRVKPGNYMATVPLASNEMQPLLDYLESLK